MNPTARLIRSALHLAAVLRKGVPRKKEQEAIDRFLKDAIEYESERK